MKAAALHTSGSWFIGTIVALAIREGLTRVIPHIVEPSMHSHSGLHADLLTWRLSLLEIIRLCVFLLVMIRFFLGSVQFFADALEEAEKSGSSESYGKDFLFGIVHFVVFVGWAVTMDVHDLNVPWYLIVLGVVLAYDIPWCMLRRKSAPNHRLVRLWAVINFITVMASALIYVLMRLSLGDYLDLCEEVTLVPVIIFSAFDLGGILTDNPAFPRWVKGLVA